MISISVIVPTCGRMTLTRALASVRDQLSDHDEVLVVGDGRQPSAERAVARLDDPRFRYFEHGPTGFLGNAQRNFAADRATGQVLVFLDDDDVLAATALADVRRAWDETPGRPMMFRIQFHDPPVLKWREPTLADENISGGSFVIPNLSERMARWPEPPELGDDFADRKFILDTLKLWPADALVWREEILYHVPKASLNAP